MTEATFTPGPWGCDGSHVYAPDGEIIAVVYNPGTTASAYPLVANRNLITASPDMFTALENIVAWADGIAAGAEIFKEARAALAKARKP